MTGNRSDKALSEVVGYLLPTNLDLLAEASHQLSIDYRLGTPLTVSGVEVDPFPVQPVFCESRQKGKALMAEYQRRASHRPDSPDAGCDVFVY